MALFGKKKKTKTEESGAKAAPSGKKEKAGTESGDEGDAPPKRPEWARKSEVDLEEVETAIDLGADRQSRSNILEMYEDKYGEKLEAPEFSAGLKYEYQLYEEADVLSERDLSWLEEGEEAGEEAGEEKEKTGLFGKKKAKKKAEKKAATVTEEGEVVAEGEEEKEAKPSFFDPDKKVEWGRSAFMSIVLGKPLAPIAGLIKYKAREPQRWMHALVILDILTIVIPVSWLLWRFWTRAGYEVAFRVNKKKAREKGLDPDRFDNLFDLRRAMKERAKAEVEEKTEPKETPSKA